MKLRDDYVARKKRVPTNYAHIVVACDHLTRALARDGIRAMVDLATGYQADKAREDALKIIALYVAPGLMPWTRKFPHEFFRGDVPPARVGGQAGLHQAPTVTWVSSSTVTFTTRSHLESWTK